jgi:hypothetical protein
MAGPVSPPTAWELALAGLTDMPGGRALLLAMYAGRILGIREGDADVEPSCALPAPHSDRRRYSWRASMDLGRPSAPLVIDETRSAE